MKNALILHGTDASPQSNWFSWLDKELTAEGYKVWLPQLPHSEQPSVSRYNKFILASDFEFNSQTIIVGHSSGAVEILGLLQELDENKRVDMCFLVSAFKDDLGWEALRRLFDKPFDFEVIKSRAKKFVFIHSDNDPYCPLEHAKFLCEQVDGKLIVLSGQKHFNLDASAGYTEFPDLLTMIKQI